LKELGIRIALDDFGTGYSSLSYLRRFPLDSLKIDRSFIADVVENIEIASIVTAIIAMAHSLGLTAVAEGVENEEQLTFLREQGCDEFQGHFFSPPVAPEALAELVRNARGGQAVAPRRKVEVPSAD
jgi:EAL domain-containing protein (putative c-di-GMP-specific phosphodiesterase class I)